ncbi:ROK family transcriptional regulator [Salipaludibacillus agaradhaerens]|uniref:ROK family transcriptional regulator n=1 Tax=Salipaludibacillus agaradhaerens TaxID=76935 RepID=UPI00099877D7|nr:ROK family transcriptional regulator [Salipaludibacillus agaradhaerens]
MEVKASKFIKDKNRKKILEEIVRNRRISRSELSKITTLNKVTTSAQVKSLLDDGLISEEKVVHATTSGRRPLKLTLIAQSAYFLGIDIDTHHINFLLSDLNGYPIHNDIVAINDNDFDSVMKTCLTHIKKYQELEIIKASQYGLANIVFGVHGIVSKDEKIAFIPQHQWSNCSIKAYFKDILDVRVITENSTNLCAYAEYTFQKETDNLISISTYSGIGLGLVNNNDIFKGFHGFAGEVGHMIIEKNGLQCNCGNRGCWELYASEKALLARVGKGQKKGQVTLSELEELYKSEDDLTITAVQEHLDNLAIGLNNILNIYNPESIVINSGLTTIIDDLEAALIERLQSKMNNYSTLKVSHVGKSACVIGACALGIRDFLNIDDLYIDSSQYDEIMANSLQMIE